jgi:hypothetical protein
MIGLSVGKCDEEVYWSGISEGREMILNVC